MGNLLQEGSGDVVQAKATDQRRRPRLSLEKLLDRAEGFMTMKGLSPTAAVRQAMPDELLAIPMDDLRGLVESALIAKLAQRRSRERYSDTEKRAREIERLTASVMKKINANVQKKAEILARVTYVMHGAPTPLLTMSLEDHVSKRTEAQRTRASAEGRYRFHDAAVKALKDASANQIADLNVDGITELAELAEGVWGAQS